MAHTFRIVRTSDDDERMAFGYASVSFKTDGEEVVDSYGDVIAPEEIERAAYGYVLNYREGGYQHERMGVARLIESFVITPDKLTKMGLAGDALPTGWWIGMKVDSAEVWKKIKSGEVGSFSIAGKARREEVK